MHPNNNPFTFQKLTMHPYKEKKNKSWKGSKEMEVLNDSDEEIQDRMNFEEAFSNLTWEVNKLCAPINTCQYRAIQELTKIEDMNEYFSDFNADISINICPYQINNLCSEPFLEYLLFKHCKNEKHLLETMEFMSFKKTNADLSGLSVFSFIETTLNIAFKCYANKGTYKYEGILHDEKNVYIFINFSDFQIGAQFLYKTNDLWLVGIHDIVNLASVCGFPISSLITSFFIEHPAFAFLHSEDGHVIETPTIAYSSANGNMVDMKGYFGEPRRCIEGLGSYHYFTSFDNALSEGAAEKGRSGIVRSAIFLKSCIFVSGDELIASKNDSLYVGYHSNIKTPLWGIRCHLDQVPLSYHYIEEATKSTLPCIL